jgi:asparagine synthase (glutamine-hydrolysing)
VSAICGVVGRDGRPWDVTDLDAMVRELAPLGSDGGGSWAGTTGRCGLAVAAALRHSTPEDAAERQPARGADDSIVLVADLRIDNRAELAGLLRLTDDSSIPDSAFLLASYHRWGEAMLGRIVGEFALALVDTTRGGVLLARDHAGARPLVTHERAGVVAFSSTPLALTALEGVGHGLDVAHAAEVLALAYSSERTFVKGVRWLPAGTAMWVESSRVRRWRWWKPDPHEIVDLGSAAAHERELREAFDLAVAARLRSSGPIGAMTSGGLDSASAAATAARLVAPRPLPTFTSAPLPGWRAGERHGWDADESPLVRELAAMYPNMDPTFVHVPHDSNLLDLQEPLWKLGAGPVLNPGNMLWVHAIMVQAGIVGVTTLVTGNIGNFFFSADGPRWLVSHLRAGHAVTALREAAAWTSRSGDGWYQTVRNYVAPYLVPAWVLARLRRVTGRASLVDEWLSTTAVRPEVVSNLALTELLPQLTEKGRRDTRAVALSMLHFHAGQADVPSAVTAITGVDARDPTADRRVIEVALRQPEWVRRHDGATRAVVRGAMADRLPPSIVRRHTRGEQLPDWLDLMTAARADLAAEIGHMEDHSTSRELIDTVRMRELLSRWPERSARADPKVIADYRSALLRALLVSRYLRWFEGRAAAANSAAA